MRVVYFFGFTFKPDNYYYHKIDHFRSKYDRKYNRCQLLQLSILPPFLLDNVNRFDLTRFYEESHEIISDHLMFSELHQSIEFAGIKSKFDKTGMIYLALTCPEELFHLQESLQSLIAEHGGQFQKHKNFRSVLLEDKIVLPLGRVTHQQFEVAMIEAQQSFDRPFSLKLNSMALFEKKPGIWPLKMNLFSYPISHDNQTEFSLQL